MKHSLFASLAVVAASLLASPQASASAYPDKPIRFICTAAAGSPLDLMMRTLGKFLGDELKQPVVVENRAGGTGAVGMATAKNMPADGYTVVSATGSTSFLMADNKSAHSPDDFVFIRGLQAEPSAIAVRGDSPYRTMTELIQALRATPDKVSVGGFGAAGFHQFVFYRLQQAADFKAIWVPFNGGNQAVLALLGKQLDAAVITPSSALAQLQSGEIRLLGISTAARTRYFPDTPTFKEQGYDVVESLWRGVMVKKGTPAPVIATLSAAMDRVEARSEWKTFMVSTAQLPLNYSVDRMQNLVHGEVTSRRQFLQSMGLAK